MSYKGGTFCVVRGCSSKTGGNLSLFSFPKDPERVKYWLKACNREDLRDKNLDALHRNYKVCENHFEEKYLSKGGETRKHLFQEAIPTIFPGTLKRSLAEGIPIDVISEECGKMTKKKECGREDCWAIG